MDNYLFMPKLIRKLDPKVMKSELSFRKIFCEFGPIFLNLPGILDKDKRRSQISNLKLKNYN